MQAIRAGRSRTSPTRVLVMWGSVFVVGLAALLASIHPGFGNEADIRVDGIGYHAWVPAILRGDLNFCGDAGLVTTGATPAAPNSAGHCPMKYPPGLGMVEFAVMAPLSLANHRSFSPSDAENFASRLLGVAALLSTCVLIVLTCRCLRVAEWATHVSVLALAFGSGLFHYGTYDNGFAHIYLAALFAALVYVGVRAGTMRDWVSRLLVFVLAFLIVETREVSVIGVACLAALWVSVHRSNDDTYRWSRDRWLRACAGGVALAVALEAVYATYARGSLALASYGSEQVKLTRFNDLHVLVGYDHGLLTWYPIIAVVLIGAFLCSSTRRAGAALLMGVVASTLLYGAWHDWRLGGGFGHRGFIDLMPGAAVVLAVALHSATPLARRRLLLAVPATVTVTLELMVGYWNGTIPFFNTTADEYWARVAGRPFAVVVAATAICAIVTRGRDVTPALFRSR